MVAEPFQSGAIPASTVADAVAGDATAFARIVRAHHLAIVALGAARATLAAGIDPATLNPVPPDIYTCRATGSGAICNAHPSGDLEFSSGKLELEEYYAGDVDLVDDLCAALGTPND